MKKFAAVRTAYYKDQALTKDVKKNLWLNEKQFDGSTIRVKKTSTVTKSYKSAIAELEHVQRTGNTQSANVFDKFSHNNVTASLKGSDNLIDAYHKLKAKYKKTTGKKCRSDMNTLLEHVIILSNEYVEHLEQELGFKNAHAEIDKCIRSYCDEFSEKFGFSKIGYNTHYDEGVEKVDENGNKTFKRNFHCHALFFNYDFNNKVSNLKKLGVKGIDPETGKTRELNPHFQQMQFLIADNFSSLGFVKGISKTITKREHLSKSLYIQKKLQEKEAQLLKLTDDFHEQINRVIGYLSQWFNSIFNHETNAELYADLTVESLSSINSYEIRQELQKCISENEQRLEIELQRPISNNQSIINKIKNKK